MRTTISILVVFSSLSLTTPILAQSPRGKIGLGVKMGGGLVSGDIHPSRPGFDVGGLLRYNPVPFFALTASTSFMGRMNNGFGTVKTNILATSLSTTLFLLPARKVSPYFEFGFSAFQYSTKNEHNEALLRPDGTAYTGWDRAFQIGLGMECFVAQSWAVSAVADFFLTQGDDLDGLNKGGNDRFLNGGIGLVHYFGGSDHNQPEDNDFSEVWQSAVGTEDFEVDDSGDQQPAFEPSGGMVDAAFEQTSGETAQNTPEADLAEETTPAPETAMTPQEWRQTRPYDQEAEQMPQRTESSRAAPSAESPRSESSAASNGVFFKQGTAKILNRSKAYLRQIYRFLKDNPDEVVELHGFPVNSGDEAKDKYLSMARARAVKSYLVNLGIQPDRVIVVEE